MRFFRFILYFLLSAYLVFIGVLTLRNSEGHYTYVKFPEVKGRSLQLGFRIKEIATKRPKYVAKAQKFFVDTKGKTYLNGEVRIEIPSSNTLIMSEKCVVSRGKSRIEFPEQVSVKSKTGIFYGEKALYLSKKEVIRLNGNIRFVIGDIKGRASGGRMDLEKKEIILKDPSFTSQGVSLSGRKIKVLEDKMKGILRGKKSKMKGDKSVLLAPVMELDMKERKINSIFTPKGGLLLYEGKRLFGERMNFNINGNVTAEVAIFRKGNFFLRARKITKDNNGIKAEGCFMKEGNLSLVADSLFYKEGEFIAKGNVKGRIGNASFSSDQIEEKDGKRVLKGHVRFLKQGNIIEAEEAEERNNVLVLSRARIISPGGTTLRAQRIRYSSEEMELEGGASVSNDKINIIGEKIVIKIENGKLISLYTENPRKISLGQDRAQCKILEYYFEKRKAILKGGVRLNSHEHGEIKGEYIIVYPETGSFEIKGKGRSTSEIKQ